MYTSPSQQASNKLLKGLRRRVQVLGLEFTGEFQPPRVEGLRADGNLRAGRDKEWQDRNLLGMYFK